MLNYFQQTFPVINNKVLFCSAFDAKINGNLTGLNGEVLSSDSESSGENDDQRKFNNGQLTLKETNNLITKCLTANYE